MGASDRLTAEAAALLELLPEGVTTKSGVVFNPRVNPWDYQDGPFQVRINFDRIPRPFYDLIPGLQNTLLFFVRHNAPCYVKILFEAFLQFVRAIDHKSELYHSIGLVEVGQFVNRLKEREAYRVGPLNVVLQKWFALGFAGVDEECVQYLRERRKPGNSKGDYVRTHDPVHGPLTEQEYTLLYRALDNAYGSKNLQQWAFVLSRLLFAAGQRISQYASMKLIDIGFHVEEARPCYRVRIPQVKRRDEHARVSFLTFDLTPQTGELLVDYRNSLRAQGLTDDSPLFPSTRDDAGQGLFEGHCSSPELSRRFMSVVGDFVPVTNRLDGADLPIAPRRFRYSFGTRMAEEGCSPVVIANRLGHADLQQVKVYTEDTPRIVDNLDAAMDGRLAPLAQAFRGTVISGEDSASLAGAPGTRIYDFKAAKASVGSCGQTGGCGFNKPVACYTCFKFEPWLDAPHEKLLKTLEEEREKNAGDPRIAAVNDDAILAIREVIAECDAIRAQHEVEVDQ
jgi:integrase